MRLVIAIAVGAVLAAAAGFIVGVPALRLQGDYLAIVTCPRQGGGRDKGHQLVLGHVDAHAPGGDAARGSGLSQYEIPQEEEKEGGRRP